jgi:hypothetical protein
MKGNGKMTGFAFFLVLFSGICWTFTYIYSIYIGSKDKADAMPFVALALNITWEALYTVTGLQNSMTNIQAWINLVWVLFDIGLFYLYFKYGKEEFSRTAPKKYFMLWSVFILVMSAALQIIFRNGFGMASADMGPFSNLIDSHLGAWYSAFIQNLIMSVLYISMFIKRKGNKGQSPWIAIAKCLGTLAPTILFGFIFKNNVIAVLGAFTFMLDVTYVYMTFKNEKFFSEKD